DRGHLADERVVLRHVADARPRLAHVAPAVHAEDAGRPGARPEKAEQRQEQGGLARPVGPEQAHRLPRAGNAETAGDPVEDLPPSQRDLQVFQFDDGCGFQALYCCPRFALPRFSISIRSMISPEIRVRLAAWIRSGEASNITRIGSCDET